MASRLHPEIGLDTMKNVAAIVLGGGRGTRLYPLTWLRSKPAVPLCGRFRLVDIPLSNCINSGIKKIVVLTQFNSHSLNRHLHNTYRFDQFSEGYVDILAAEQTMESGDWYQGTADAVRKQLLHIRNLRAKHYVVLAGDQLYRMDYESLIATHLRKEAAITISALPVTRTAAKGFGVMKVHKNGRIYEFVEKPKEAHVLDSLISPDQVFKDFGLEAGGKPYLASMGVYAFKAEVLESLVEGHPEWIDFGKELIPNSLASHRVMAHMFNGFWEDIGTVRSYFDVSMKMTSPDPPFDFRDQENIIYTHKRDLPGVQIHSAKINNAIICGGSVIQDSTISEAIIGIRSVIRKGARIERSIILGNERFELEDDPGNAIPLGVGQNSRISEAIVDHNARIGKNVVIRGSKELGDSECDEYAVRDGIVVVKKNAVIPDGTVIGQVE